jgi:hypothetical protein
MTRIVIGVPHTGSLKAPTVLSLVGLVGQTPHPIRLALHQGPFVHENRNVLAQGALDAEASHLFFLDSDIACPDDTLVRLLAHNLPIVGANYHTRESPSFSTVKMFVETKGEDLPTALFPCKALGTGCLLIQTDVLRDLATPWFNLLTTVEGRVLTGEDVWFCELARAGGYEVYCDPTIRVSHVGDYGY